MKHRGRGVACGWYGIARTAAMDRAAVWVELDDGGTVKIATGVTEIDWERERRPEPGMYGVAVAVVAAVVVASRLHQTKHKRGNL